MVVAVTIVPELCVVMLCIHTITLTKRITRWKNNTHTHTQSLRVDAHRLMLIKASTNFVFFYGSSSFLFFCILFVLVSDHFRYGTLSAVCAYANCIITVVPLLVGCFESNDVHNSELLSNRFVPRY